MEKATRTTLVVITILGVSVWVMGVMVWQMTHH